ncbi:Tad-like/von Willebrand factor A domain-containing protein [Rhizobium etli 8C-3]|uniref:Tad-like/von Willebrand factor A domain-containing protein n=1 Tax=Rhizobium etli 8C-3 TaxID=538025 RepID=A0A1L5P890_RHIET|nr:pilus assembly protein [Rhizobium etli]APO76282.1 Tad-like/von Willebrand factor A domain-containing protein [Rhizobium etli 8C-3]
MSPISFLGAKLARLVRDCSGNFAMMTAILMPIAIGAAGLAVDVSNMMLSQRQLQEASDSAALAAASALVAEKVDVDGAKELAKNFVIGQMSNYIDDADTIAALRDAMSVVVTETASSSGGKSFKVEVKSAYNANNTALMRVMGKEATRIGALSKTESSTENTVTKSSLSMYLVLDRSGSMAEDTTASYTRTESYNCGTKKNPKTCDRTVTDYYTKIEALKLAVSSLLTQLNTADPNLQYVRTGSVSYNDQMQSALNLAWGTSAVSTYVNVLTATGGTDSSDAFKAAYNKLVDPAENAAHLNKNGLTPDKYIVFMTDGNNNYTSADTETKTWCNLARENNITVYTVAFMAPDRGKALLSYCATSSSTYFEAENMASLVAAFKIIGSSAAKQSIRLTQ